MILVVDNDHQIVQLMCEFLKMTGVRYLAAGGPRVAQFLWEKHRDEISVVVTDIRMPGMNGDELASSFFERQTRAEVVLMSGTPWEANTPLEQRLNFFQKPFLFNEVVGRVKEVVGCGAL